MTKALSFMKLDFITIKPFLTAKNQLILLLAPCIITFSGGSAPFSIGLIMMFGVTYASYPFSVGEQNGIDFLYTTLSIPRRTVVLGRYLFVFLVDLCAGILSYVLTFLLFTLFKKEFDPITALPTALAVCGVFLLIQLAQLPIYFKLGFSASRTLAYLPYLTFPLIALAVPLLQKYPRAAEFVKSAALWIMSNTSLFAILCVALLLAAAFVSYRISLSVYKKREL